MYKIVKYQNKYRIIEIETGHVLIEERLKRVAKSKFDNLNRGTGFVGFTPAFVANETLQNVS